MMRSSTGTAALTDLPDLCLDAPAAAGSGAPVRGGRGGGAGPVDKKRSSSTPSSKSLSSSAEDRSSSEDDVDQQCGWGPVQPGCCQVFRNAKVVLFFLCCLAAIQVTCLLVCQYLLANILHFLHPSVCLYIQMRICGSH